MKSTRMMLHAALLLFLSSVVTAQALGQARHVELSVPFGIVSGKLVISGENLIFIDDQRPEASFVMNRRDVQDMRLDDGMLVVELAQPVRDRSGERSRLSFRIRDGFPGDPLLSWFRASPPAPQPEAGAPSSGVTTYQAKHNHRFGNCTGRLIIGDSISYESVTQLGHSRQWMFRDIKEIKRDNPYELEIRPFTGNQYNLELVGRGMDNSEYKMLVDRVTAARSGR